MRRTLIIVGAAVSVGIAALVFFLSGSEAVPGGDAAPAQVAATVSEKAPAPPRRPSTSLEHAATPSLGSIPRSLLETEIDGALRVDAAGNLIVDGELRYLFDYFLIATDEESEANIRARVAAEINRRLPPKAAAQALEVFERYMKYREAAAGLGADPAGAEDLEARLADLKRVRREQLGEATAQAIFGEEEAFDAITVQRKKIEADPALSLEERRKRIDALETQLPASLQVARAQAMAPLRNLEEEQAMIKAGATADDVQQFRKQTVGDAAAERLAQLDREEQAFQARVQAFRTTRAELISSGARPDQLEEALRAAFPLEPERLRATTLVEMQP